MTIKRFGLDRAYASNVGVPGIAELPDGEYVRHDDHAALISELQAELAGVERIVVAQTVTIAELRGAPVAAQEPSDEDIRDLLGEFGDHHVEDGYIAYDKWTLAEAGRVLLTRYGSKA